MVIKRSFEGEYDVGGLNVDGRVIRPLLLVAEGLGCSRYDLMNQACIEPDWLLLSDKLIPLEAYLRLVQLVEQAACTEDLGLYVGRVMHVTEANVMKYLFGLGDSMRDCLKFYPTDLKGMFTDIGQLSTRRDGKYLRLEYLPLPSFSYEGRFLADQFLCCATLNMASFSIYPVRAIRAEFTYPKPAYMSVLQDCFMCDDLRFDSDMNCIYFDQAVLDYPVIHAADDLSDEVSSAIQKMLSETCESSPLLRGVGESIARALSRGATSIDQVATEHNLSARSLQRKLKQEGTSFSEALQNVRKSMACHYLESKHMNVTQTALMLGYSSPESFARAYKGWFGSSPTLHCQD